MLLILWEISVATAMVLYDGANNLYGRYSNIETGGGGGGFTCEYLQMH